jgi:hypothetical protein
MKEIELTQGKVAVIDDEDAESVSQRKWFYYNGYAWAKFNGKAVSLHRFIMNALPGELVDHADLDRLNCQRSNLRHCSYQQNRANARRNKVNKTGFKGVYPTRRKQKPFRAAIKFSGNTIYLGCFGTPEEAARAYDEKAKELFGEFARTNF